MQLSIDRTLLAVFVATGLLGILTGLCLFAGYGYLALRPLPTPTLSLVQSVRATGTVHAVGLVGGTTSTNTPPPALELSPTASPCPTPEETSTDAPAPTVQPTVTDPSPTPSRLAATPTLRPTATETLRPSPTSSPEPPPQPTTSLTLGPYLQQVTPYSIMVVWETSAEVDSVVEYGRTQAYGSFATDRTTTTRHAVTLTALNPHTTYHYRVKTSSQVLGADRTFKTAAGPQQTSFTFMVMSDTHAGVYEFPRRQRLIDTAHRDLMDSVAALGPDLYLHVGDLVQEGGDLAAWNDFLAIEGDVMSRTAMFPALGNHETDHENYFDLFYLPHNERWYSFQYGNAHFICLQIDGYADISPASDQYIWLETELAKTDATWTLVFFHFPALSSGGGYESDPGVQTHLIPLFQRYGVDMVFNGHEHKYQHNLADGITYMQISGRGGMTHPPGSFAWTLPSEATRHVLRVEVRGNTLTSTAISPDGSRLDEFSLIAD